MQYLTTIVSGFPSPSHISRFSSLFFRFIEDEQFGIVCKYDCVIFTSVSGLWRSTPPPSRSVFNRARSGSAPSPIKVVRNSRDFKKYHIAVVTPLSGGSEKEEAFESARTEHDSRGK
ncbi:hypothetical protein PTI98_003791 [Pleurotus ostreatus]|nr:hypothetical protein PTI98_003791 [Pleurotus ostreatus]